ncbi:MAG: hypothetical protein ACPIC3_04685, partial [Candidatus Puniceispirillaceae bacterium]
EAGISTKFKPIFILAYILCLSQMNLKLGIPNIKIEKNLFLRTNMFKKRLYTLHSVASSP